MTNLTQPAVLLLEWPRGFCYQRPSSFNRRRTLYIVRVDVDNLFLNWTWLAIHYTSSAR